MPKVKRKTGSKRSATECLTRNNGRKKIIIYSVLEIAAMPKVKRKTGSKRSATECLTRNNGRKKIVKDEKEEKVIVPCLNNVKDEKEEKVIVPCLNNDIVANIFTRISADLLHKNFRYQCKEWFNILSHPNFKDANLLKSKSGILFLDHHNDEDEGDTKVMGFIEFEGLELTTREINTFTADLRIMSSCNGLVLARDRMKRPPVVFVLNPSTKESIKIPPCEHECLCHDLVFVPSTREYKLVDMFYERSVGGLALHIRRLGGGGWVDDAYCFSDSLRRIRIPSIYYSKMADVYSNERISVDGILYVNIGSRMKIVSFDVCNQSVLVLRLPHDVGGKDNGLAVAEESNVAGAVPVRLIELGGFLSVVDFVGDKHGDFPLNSFPLDVWILKDRDMGIWEKKFKINAFPEHLHQPELYFCWFNIVGSLNDGEEIVFVKGSNIFVYYVKAREWKLTIVKAYDMDEYCRRLHVNNLISLN